MASPRLDAAGPLALRMWVAAGQPPVDGVIVMDPAGLAAVIDATGPVEVGGERFDAASIVPEVLHGQYEGVGSDPAEQLARREVLASLARAAFSALDRGNWSPATLIDRLAEAVRGRHLMAWSSDPVEQRGWSAAGMDGALSADSLAVAVENRGGNKLDWHLDVDGAIETVPSGSGTDVTVRLTLRNDSPAGLSRYVGGPPPGLTYPNGTYRGIVAVNVPGVARGLAVDGVAMPVVFGPDGPTQVIGVPVEVGRSTTTTTTVRFRLPGRAGQLVVEPSARIPSVTWRYGADSWEDTAPRTANWGVAHRRA